MLWTTSSHTAEVPGAGGGDGYLDGAEGRRAGRQGQRRGAGGSCCSWSGAGAAPPGTRGTGHRSCHWTSRGSPAHQILLAMINIFFAEIFAVNVVFIFIAQFV